MKIGGVGRTNTGRRARGTVVMARRATLLTTALFPNHAPTVLLWDDDLLELDLLSTGGLFNDYKKLNKQLTDLKKFGVVSIFKYLSRDFDFQLAIIVANIITTNSGFSDSKMLTIAVHENLARSTIRV